MIPWVHTNLIVIVFKGKNQLSVTFTLSWDSVDLPSLSQLPTRGIGATKLYKKVTFPKVSGQVHCSLSDIKKN